MYACLCVCDRRDHLGAALREKKKRTGFRGGYPCSTPKGARPRSPLLLHNPTTHDHTIDRSPTAPTQRGTRAPESEKARARRRRRRPSPPSTASARAHTRKRLRPAHPHVTHTEPSAATARPLPFLDPRQQRNETPKFRPCAPRGGVVVGVGVGARGARRASSTPTPHQPWRPSPPSSSSTPAAASSSTATTAEM